MCVRVCCVAKQKIARKEKLWFSLFKEKCFAYVMLCGLVNKQKHRQLLTNFSNCHNQACHVLSFYTKSSVMVHNLVKRSVDLCQVCHYVCMRHMNQCPICHVRNSLYHERMRCHNIQCLSVNS